MIVDSHSPSEPSLIRGSTERKPAAVEGTRFRLFPQAPYSGTGTRLETVSLPPRPGGVGSGPSDDRLYLVDPIGKSRPYGTRLDSYRSPGVFLPPWRGAVHPRAEPDADGHFDYLEPGMRPFEAAHVYGCLRMVQDVWEGYFGGTIPWHFRERSERLEVVLLPHMNNATAGYGFIEIGAYPTDDGDLHPFSLSFDTIAHELGHLIVYSIVGRPDLGAESGEYFGFHESAADLVALVAVLHFDSVLELLLQRTRGNLYTWNLLNRFVELSANHQIRMASNPLRLSDFAAGWIDEHDLAQPLTGAMFDIFVDIFHEKLLDRGLIDCQAEDVADLLQRDPAGQGVIQGIFDDAHPQNPDGFKLALIEARDYLGKLIAECWRGLEPNRLNYADVAEGLVAVDHQLSGGRFKRHIENNIGWRDIGRVTVGPRLAPPDGSSHAFSVRSLAPEDMIGPVTGSYRDRWLSTRTGRCCSHSTIRR